MRGAKRLEEPTKPTVLFFTPWWLNHVLMFFVRGSFVTPVGSDLDERPSRYPEEASSLPGTPPPNAPFTNPQKASLLLRQTWLKIFQFTCEKAVTRSVHFLASDSGIANHRMEVFFVFGDQDSG